VGFELKGIDKKQKSRQVNDDLFVCCGA